MKDNIAIYESAQDMMICELDKLIQKNEVSPTTLDYIDKIVDIIKDLYEVCTDEENRMNMYDDYSGRSGRMYDRGSVYGNDGYYRRGSSYGSEPSMRSGTSRDTSKQAMLDHLYAAHDTASSEEERKRIKRMIDEIESSK